MLCYVSIYIAPFPLVSKCSKALFSSLSRCVTHHSMFNVMFLESNQETVLACSRYRALPTIFMTGSAGIWTQGLITSWLKLWCSRPFTHASPNIKQSKILRKTQLPVSLLRWDHAGMLGLEPNRLQKPQATSSRRTKYCFSLVSAHFPYTHLDG
jgi:hypothetical protein